MTIGLNALEVEVHVWQADLDVLAAPAGAVLRRVLAGYLDEDPAAIELRQGEHGKPALAEWPPRLHFNLSHSGMLALIALTRKGEVGVDVEREDVERDFARLARRFLGAEQADALRRVPVEQQTATFYAAWVRREAAAKCFGAGLGGGPPPRPPSIRDLDIGGGYAAAVALDASGMLPLRRFSVGRAASYRSSVLERSPCR